jgi:hypothetical protein
MDSPSVRGGHCLALLEAIVFALLLTTSTAAHASSYERVDTEHGPVVIWEPTGYDVETAGIVIYVHGYFTDLDRAWDEQHLAAQFAASNLNAMFIACDAPSDWRSAVKWTSVTDLLTTVARATDEPLPDGRLVVVGHSGAHRTIVSWLGDSRIQTIMLVDALYGNVDAFEDWVTSVPTRRLIDAASVTKRWSEQLHARLPETLCFDGFPSDGNHLVGARSARVVYVRSQLDHMSLVTGGVALPMLLRTAVLPRLSAAGLEDGASDVR